MKLNKQYKSLLISTLQIVICGVLIFLFKNEVTTANPLNSFYSIDLLKNENYFNLNKLNENMLNEENLYEELIIEDKVDTNNDSLELESIVITKTKSPTTALYYSVIPGLGQYYVESYWKAPLFFGGAASLTGLMVYFNNEFISDRDKIETMVNPYTNQYVSENNPLRTNEKHIGLENFTYDKSEFTYLKNRREFNRDNRDRMGFFLGILYLVSAVDAYVGANLYNFNVDDKLSYKVLPNLNNGASVNISYKF